MSRRTAVTGAAGQLGRALVEILTSTGDEVLALARPSFDLTVATDLERVVAWRPDVVINAAAWTDVDGCARDPALAMRINAEGARSVADAAARVGALGVQISTNEVFDGKLERGYLESDPTNPINPYGASKLAGERLAASANPRTIVVRTAWLYSDGRGFPTKILEADRASRRAGVPLRVVTDEWGNPTPADWLADAIRSLVGIPAIEPGVYHLAGVPPVNRYEWARHLLGGNGGRLLPITRGDFERASEVPERAILDVSRASTIGITPVDWRQHG